MIPAAGLGTRLFPATIEQPKEMLPIFSSSINSHMSVKPVLQMVFEQVYDAGLREFCFIVGRGKRSIEDHFTPDIDTIGLLKKNGNNIQASDLVDFYRKLRNSTIMWVNQSEAKGFGHAVLMSKPFVQNEQCLVHAGDSCIISKNMDYINKLLAVHQRFDADISFIVLEIMKPLHYGIIEGKEIEKGIVKVESAIEKPEKPATNMAIMAMYTFKPIIFTALEAIKPGKAGELQLTDAIQKAIDWGLNVYGVKMNSKYSHLDIGNPQRYWKALKLSHKHYCGDTCI